ncbi:MAG: LysR substrate-binding domain-containing protein, partial [Achromobacter xylosoxidans]|nr:LysR substrate-binding domain-containing protein [Achromobacter xylosoxidans]
TELGQTELVHLGRGPAGGPLALADVAGDNLILLDASDAAGALLQMALDAQGVDPHAAIRVQTHYVACALAQAGAGDAIVDAITAQAMLRPDMRLRRLSPTLGVPISVLTRSQDPLTAVHRDLIDRLRAACDASQAALER